MDEGFQEKGVDGDVEGSGPEGFVGASEHGIVRRIDRLFPELGR